MAWSDHCNTVVVRWVLREKGITLTGPPAADLVPSISRELLCDESPAVIEDWGGKILANPARFAETLAFVHYCIEKGAKYRVG